MRFRVFLTLPEGKLVADLLVPVIRRIASHCKSRGSFGALSVVELDVLRLFFRLDDLKRNSTGMICIIDAIAKHRTN